MGVISWNRRRREQNWQVLAELMREHDAVVATVQEAVEPGALPDGLRVIGDPSLLDAPWRLPVPVRMTRKFATALAIRGARTSRSVDAPRLRTHATSMPPAPTACRASEHFTDNAWTILGTRSGWPARRSWLRRSTASTAGSSASSCRGSTCICLPWLTSPEINGRGRPGGRPPKIRSSPTRHPANRLTSDHASDEPFASHSRN